MGEHYVDIVGVAGSIPAAPTIYPSDIKRLFGLAVASPIVVSDKNKSRTSAVCSPRVGNLWAICSLSVLGAPANHKAANAVRVRGFHPAY